MFLLFAIVVLCYLFYKWAVKNNEYFKNKGVAFTKPVFLLGSNANMFFNRLSFPEVCEKWYNSSNEKISGMFEFRKPVFLVRDPKLLKKMAVKDFDHFVDHRVIIDEDIDKMFGKSLISLTGNKWRDMRATLSPMFTGSKMRMMYNHVAKVGKQSAETVKANIKAGGDEVCEFKTLTTKFTVDVIASCAFGIEVNSFEKPNNDFHRIAIKATDFGNWKVTLKFVGYMIAAPFMKYFKVQLFDKEIETFFQEAVQEMMKIREEKGIIRHDMINLLIQAKKGNLSHEVKDDEKISEGFATVEESSLGKSQVKTVWDDDDLAAQCFIFFFAGFDTVSTTMGFMGYELAINPEVQEKLFEEIKSMEEELDGKIINYDQIQRLKYMDQVVCETLRKWPAAPATDRICVKDYEVEVDNLKFTIEKGVNFMVPIYGMHRDPAFYPEPLKFDPERFSDENRGSIDPDTYLPFGIGPRNCIGSRFALMEMKTVFYYLLINFSFEVCEKTQIPLKYHKSPIGLKTEKGIWISLRPRD